MKYLLDTHIALWALISPLRLSAATRSLLSAPSNDCFFSPVSLWEVVIKRGPRNPSFDVEANILHRQLLDNDYIELPVTSDHALAVGSLPPIHKDPFDRLLIAQATTEGITLLTRDADVLRYPGPIRRA